MNETSLTRAADPVYVGIGSTLHTSAGSVACTGLEKESDLMEKSIPNPDYLSPAAEESTVPPVASAGQVYFMFMVDCAIDQGYISREGAEAVLRALYPEASHE